jgi:hypothetical protein
VEVPLVPEAVEAPAALAVPADELVEGDDAFAVEVPAALDEPPEGLPELPDDDEGRGAGPRFAEMSAPIRAMTPRTRLACPIASRLAWAKPSCVLMA